MTQLRQRMLEELQRRNYSPATTRSYILSVKQFAEYFGRSPEKLGAEEIRRYQLHLLKEKKVSAGTVKIRMSALRFLYKKTLKRPDLAFDDLVYPKRPKKLPVVLSPEEVARLIEAARHPMHRTILMVLYGTGMRRTEASLLKVSDIDSQRMVIHIRHGKGSQDRDVPLRPKLLEALREYWRGGHLDVCTGCGYLTGISYNSCRNRHCPKCQTGARETWLAKRQQELLPVNYFHLVFSLPHSLVPLIWQNKKVLFTLLFDAAAATLLQVAADPKHLGAEIGFLSILHTWGQTLQPHPHIHCVVPGGGLSPDHECWRSTPAHFFLPVRVLSRVFRGKFVAGLRRAFRANQLAFYGDCLSLANETQFAAFLRTLFREDWVVYSKPPFGGPEHVLHYLARYTHRVAISNHRILAVSDSHVAFPFRFQLKAGQLLARNSIPLH